MFAGDLMQLHGSIRAVWRKPPHICGWIEHYVILTQL